MDEKLILSAIKENSKLLHTIYEDLAQPGVRKVGRALSTIFDVSNTILLPIKLLNEKTKERFDRRMNEYKEKLEGIPDEKINDVPPEIGIPIMDRLTYITEDEISDKFLNLLASASSKDEINSIHPSFIQMLDRITVDEARILEYLNTKIRVPYINVGNLSPDKTVFSVLDHHLTGIESEIKLNNPKRIRIYLQNLTSMGILNSSEGAALDEPHRYPELEKLYSNSISICHTQCTWSPMHRGSSVHIGNGYYEVTDFGRSFIWTCMKRSTISKIYKMGLKVKHDVYGVGEIIYTESDEKIAVQFDGQIGFFQGKERLDEVKIIDYGKSSG